MFYYFFTQKYINTKGFMAIRLEEQQTHMILSNKYIWVTHTRLATIQYNSE